jgi:hypothetical protein
MKRKEVRLGLRVYFIHNANNREESIKQYAGTISYVDDFGFNVNYDKHDTYDYSMEEVNRFGVIGKVNPNNKIVIQE